MSTSEPDDFDPPEDLICTNTPMPPNTKKCGHEGNYSACLCGTYDALLEGVVDTPSLDKSEHDGTCRTPECYEKRPTPAVEKCGCPVPNGIFKQKGRTAWYECSKCGKGIEFTITPTPEKEKCKSCNDFGFWTDSSGKPYKCNEASHTKPTPAVEDWEGVKEAMRGFLKFPDEETANNWAKFTNSFIRSLLKSDRKRILKWAEKEKRHDILYFSDLVAFITNLK